MDFTINEMLGNADRIAGKIQGHLGGRFSRSGSKQNPVG